MRPPLSHQNDHLVLNPHSSVSRPPRPILFVPTCTISSVDPANWPSINFTLSKSNIHRT